MLWNNNDSFRNIFIFTRKKYRNLASADDSGYAFSDPDSYL